MSEPTGRRPAASWADHAEGPATAESLSALAGADPSALSGAELVDVVVAAEKGLSLLTGLQARVLAALAVPSVAGDPSRLAARLARRSCLAGDDNEANVARLVPEAAVSLAAGEVAAALRIAPVTAGIRVREAVRLTEELAPAREALEAGVIDRGKLRVLAEHTQVLPDELVGPVLEQVLPQAAVRSTGELREIAGRAVIAADPAGAQDRHRRAAARRELTLSAGTDAMATLKAFLPADGAVKIFQVSDLIATGTAGVPGDDRGVGARRVDAWVDLADQLLTDGLVDLTGYLGRPLPDHRRRGPRPERQDDRAEPVDGGDGGSPAAPAAVATFPAATAQSVAHESVAHESVAHESVAHESVAHESVAHDPVATDQVTPAEHDSAVAPGCSADPEVSDPSAAAAEPGPLDPAGPADAVGGAMPAAEDGALHAQPAENGAVEGRLADGDQGVEAADPDGSAGAARGGRVMSRQGRRPHLNVTIGLGTLAGLDQLPGTLAGFGAIPADLARSIAASAGSITALLTDSESGAVAGAGDLTYRPRQALRDIVAAVTDTCRFPSCRQPAWRCDIDHRTPFDHQHPDRGGATNASNTGPMCRRHHLFKHHTDWRVSIDPTRLLIQWTSPTGHTYTKKPRPAVIPDIWVSIPGSDTARRLDEIAEVCTAGRPTATAQQVLTGYVSEIGGIPDEPGDDRHRHGDRGSGDSSVRLGDDNRDTSFQEVPTCDFDASLPGGAEAGDGGRPEVEPRASDQTSRFEDRLTDALLRHAISSSSRIDYEPEAVAGSDTASDEHDDDPPPF